MKQKDIKQLRIGNYVKIGNYEYTVVSINDSFLGLHQKENPGKLYQMEIKRIDFIPLTEQWLFDFGFKEHNYIKGHFVKCINGFHIKIDLKTAGCINGVSIYLKNVHHLQNVIFDLSGKELTKK